MTNTSDTDKMYNEFLIKVAEADCYNKEYYEKNKERMRIYQRRYLREIKMGIRKPKKKYKTLNNGLKFSNNPITLTFN
tara:strand:+ start:39 stop:272 length:234 start_codon:yes stop_codon:yes gene_type:complete